MATTQVHVDAVRNAVTSSATCTPATVVSLKSLLLSSDSEPKLPPSSTITQAARPTTASRSAASSRPGTAASERRLAAGRHDARHATEPGLPDKEKAHLATQVVNAALKVLAEAAKPAAAAPPAPKTPCQTQPAGDEAPPKSAARGGLRRSMSTPMTPLQPRTLNRVATSPMKAAGKPAAAGCSQTTQCLATVECARVAFSALRTLHDRKAVVLPELQLEAGMSSFVAKLIGLNLLDQAYRELSILKKRLQGPGAASSTGTAAIPPQTRAPSRTAKTSKTATKTTAKTKAQQAAADPASPPLTSVTADILDYGDISSANLPTAKLIVASQLQALRIFVALKKPAHIDAALPFLRCSSKSSPIQLLSRCVNAAASSQAEQQKVIRQMETLSQLLLALAPSVSSKDDANATEPKLSIVPLAALELQSLGLETRLRCWILTPNMASADADRDILVPLSRCFSAYVRRVRALGKAPSYSSCRSRFDNILELMKTGTLEASRTSKSPLANIYQILVSVARETGHIDDAIHWATELLSLVKPGEDSAAKCCSASALLLALQLRSPEKPYARNSNALLIEVLDAIKGALKGDTNELEELLTNVCLVRKAAVNLLVSQTSSPETHAHKAHDTCKEDTKTAQPTKLLLESFVYQCPRFCLRWLGKPPAAKSSTKEFLRYEQRRQLLTHSIRHTLDSAFVVTKAMIEENRMAWDQLDTVLSDALTVLDYLGDLKATDAGSSYYVKISHFYYLSYSVLRRKNSDYAELDSLRALRRSIDSVKHRTPAEREKAQLVLKLERLAELSKATGHIGEALGALQSIRSTLVDDGVLNSVTTVLDEKSPGLAWACSNQAETLSRTLISIHRLEEVHLSWEVDMNDLDQAAVLEHRLHFIHLRSPHDKLDLSHPCIESLLSIYYPTRFPIRRLRTLLRLFSVNMDRPDVLADIALQTSAAMGLIDSQGLADDAHLASYLPYYKALLASLTGFSEGFSDAQCLQDCLSSWSAIVAASTTREELSCAIDDIAYFQTHLYSVSEFLRAMGHDSAVTSVLELSEKLRGLSSPSIESTSSASQLALDSALTLSSHYLRLGDNAKTLKVLKQVRGRLSSIDAGPTATSIGFHLSYAEYFIAIGKLDEANHHLLEAKPDLHEDSTQGPRNAKISGSQKRRLGAQACFLQSLVALEKGDLSGALQNARSSVRMLFHDWSRLEKSMERSLLLTDSSLNDADATATDVSTALSSSESSFDSGASLRGTPDAHDQLSPATTPDVSTASMAEPVKASSPEFWVLFHPLFNSMLRLSSIYAHLGVFQETLYYAEQAQKIAAATAGAMSLTQADAWLASIYLKATKFDKATALVSQARSRLLEMEQTSRKASLACELASLYRDLNDSESELAMVQQAETIIDDVSSSNCGTAPEIQVSEEPASLAVGETKKRVAAGRRTKTAAPPAAKSHARATATRKTAVGAKKAVAAAASSTPATTAVPGAGGPQPESSAIVYVQKALRNQRVMSYLKKKDWATALSIIRDGDGSTSKDPADLLRKRMALASCLLGHSTDQMAEDAVFSVIQDSTLSFPAVSSGVVTISGDGGDRLSLTKSPVAGKMRATSSAKAGRNTAGFVEMLQEAQDCLIEAQGIAAVSGDAVTLNRISSMLQSVVIVLSATSWSTPRALGHPSYASCSVELARNMTWKRERRAVLVEKAMLAKQDASDDISWWPVATTSTTGRLSDSPHRYSLTVGATIGVADTSIGRFQRDYVDIIPRDWCVISLALTENKHDLCITKLQAGQSPFVIRLPLERAISRDADNEVFNFQQGRSGLLDIVKAINDSCHDARDMTVKGAKSAWWAEREVLDNRLKELLDNVEQIWLGGFRGIFSQHVRRPVLFSRFQKTFQSILDKHLPSRRSPARGKKRGGKAPATPSLAGRVALDPRVLDLFIGLGDATVEGCDFDEALDDLLYFVVDILQFHGERNAYDEIDFDSMVVETFEALYAYHSAVRDHTQSSAAAAGRLDDHLHSILVLDKALHLFPWEALPCMQDLAVSRVPSLACLRRLILQQQPNTLDADELKGPSESGPRSGHHASLASGAYMLNPSGDLHGTEATFDGPLTSSLRGPSWTRIVGRTPTEDEFETILTKKDVLLYFGHGSGAQYIRGRTVRKLERCRATALLMGCSSAGLSYNGEFEMHGPVWDYMLAGSPAVVGTLWDVTDKDIDRFAGQTFEEWGLVPTGTFDEKTDKKAKTWTSTLSNPASLVEAVVRARDAPRFRYLTAAAVCVYGIPVYLS